MQPPAPRATPACQGQSPGSAGCTYLHLDPYLTLVVVLSALFTVGAVVQRLILAPLRSKPSMQIFATLGLLMLLEDVVLAATGGAAYSVSSQVAQVSVDIAGVQVGLVRLIALAAATLVTVAPGLLTPTQLYNNDYNRISYLSDQVVWLV